jgi:hypothetical protein
VLRIDSLTPELYDQAPLALAKYGLDDSHDSLLATDRDSVADLQYFLPGQAACRDQLVAAT